MTREYQPAPPLRPYFLLVLFLLSGACGLIYEVVWTREFNLIFGVTVHAVATVLSAFMAGLALGSYLFGRLADRVQRPLLLYALLEAGVGLFALGLDVLLPMLPGASPLLKRAAFGSPALFATLRFTTAFALLLVPTILMGGTLPVLTRWFVALNPKVGRQTGLLYAINTLGAVAGVWLGGFVLIRALGMQATVSIAAALNLLVAALVAIAGWRVMVPPIQHSLAAAGPGSDDRRAARFAIITFATSGFCALAYEVLWTRALVFFLHNSTYAFSAMLMTFLLGIALGSLAVHRIVDRLARPLFWLGLVQLLIGATTVLSLFTYRHLPDLAALVTSRTAVDTWGKAMLLLFGQSLVVLILPALLMGATFPLASRVYLESRVGVARSVGMLYGGNTIGAILGSLAAGFVLIGWIGVRNSFLALVAINALVGIWVLASDARVGRGLRAAVVVIAGVALWLVPAWIEPHFFFRSYEASKKGQHIVFYQEGATDTVFVTQYGDNVGSRVIVYADGRGTAGVGTNLDNRFYGHLPMLLHKNPRVVLNICFGVGNTAAAIAAHPIERLDIVELSANAFDAAPYFPSNDQVLEKPTVRPIVQDGRNFLLTEDGHYDLITLEPPELHTEGVVSLYTREFYQLAKARLNPGGIMSTWINVAMVPHRELCMLLKSFQAVFPHTSVWTRRTDGKYLVLVGTEDRLAIDMMNFTQRFLAGDVYADMKRLQLTNPYDWLSSFLIGEDSLRSYVGDAPLIVDDHTRLDFTVPTSVDANYGLANAFSGQWLPIGLSGGQDRIVAYYLEKARARMAVRDDLRPFLENLPGGDREWSQLEAALQARAAEREQWLSDAPELLKKTKDWGNF